MLPLIPALILLLLHGPSNVERLARDGQLPAALDAMHRKIYAPDAAHFGPAGQDALLASLVAVSSNSELTHALVALLKIATPDEAKPTPAASPLEPNSILPPAPPPAAALREGFAKAQRSRDGPASIA